MERIPMKRSLITGAAFAVLAAAAFGAVQVTAQSSSTVCIPPAVVQAWS
jgi:hypothetical protein